MTQPLFERQLRERMRREPFEPFEVIIDDRRTIFVDKPTVAFGGGRAGFIGPDGVVEFFACEHVIEFRRSEEEPAS
jgi:hypothetical protein